MEGNENRLFYLTFSNIKEFLSLYIPNLNTGLKLFVIRYMWMLFILWLSLKR